jgi:hypothetical protein
LAGGLPVTNTRAHSIPVISSSISALKDFRGPLLTLAQEVTKLSLLW